MPDCEPWPNVSFARCKRPSAQTRLKGMRAERAQRSSAPSFLPYHKGRTTPYRPFAFPPPLYSGGRARGSRSLVPVAVGEVTNGPPASGATALNATSGISLGFPSNGKSFRNGK
jgi:hypothetical protein